MHLEFDVTDEIIAETERILLPENAKFNEQARNFIRNWNDIDLQAVPGSGKTTVLLAKLIILDRYLDRHPERQGVLIISHTNAAVNEIKERIGSECRNLFNAPNFIGTIQSFVDTFLAKSYFTTKYGIKLSRVDDDSYYSAHRLPSGGARVWVEKNLPKFYEARLSDEDILVKGFPPEPINLNMESPSAQGIKEIKQEIRSRGLISYDEAYLFAFDYIAKYPKIKSLIRDRFRYIFIDEVQDMNTAQYSILEDLFHVPDSTANIYQRIGDQNQAIYNSTDGTNDNWENRNEVLHLENSQRLSPGIAQVVQPFGLQPIEIQGSRTAADSISNISPIIIVYDDDCIANVLEHYSEIIADHKESGAIDLRKESHIAIGWTTESDFEKGHIKLDAYFGDFQKNKRMKKLSQDSLDGALINSIVNFDNTGKKLKSDLMDIFLHILKLESVKNENGYYFNALSLIRYLKESDDDRYELFKGNLSELCFLTARSKKQEALDKIRGFTNTFLAWFDKETDACRDYLTSECELEPVEQVTINKKKNVFEAVNGVNVDIRTIHSVKGQTHTSVLYLDTFYYSYESQKLPKQICAESFNDATKKRKVQATKMMYVGFSRPTHLLCYAVHRSNFDDNLKGNNLENWNIVELDKVQ